MISRRDASVFAAQVAKLMEIDYILANHKHIGQNLSVAVVKADPLIHYRYPKVIENEAIYVHVDIGKTLCEMITCDNMKFEGKVCGPEEEPSYYRVGDADLFAIQCHPSCYYGPNSTVQDTNNDHVTSFQKQPTFPILQFNERTKQCNIVSPATVHFMEKPAYRTGGKGDTEKNITNFRQGFNRKPLTLDDPFSSLNYTYGFNRGYCETFFNQYNEKEMTCTEPDGALNVVFSAILGRYIVKMIKHSYNSIMKDRDPLNLQGPVLDPPPAIEPKYKKTEWLNNFTQQFPSTTLETVFFPVYGIRYGVGVDSAPRNPGELIRKYNMASDRLVFLQAEDRKQRIFQQNIPTDLDFRDSDEANQLNNRTIMEYFKQVLMALGNLLRQPEFYRDLGIQIAVDVSLIQISNILKNIAIKTIPVFFESLSTLAVSTLPSFMVTQVLRSSVARLVVITAARNLTLLLSASVSVAGVILLIVSLLDIVMQFIDPLKFNRQYSPEFIKELIKQNQTALRRQLGSYETTYTFDYLVRALIPQSEQIIISAKIAVYMLRFMYASKYFTDRDGFNPNTEIGLNNLNGGLTSLTIKENPFVKQVMVAPYIPTVQEFSDYIRDHKKRITIHHDITKIFLPWVIFGFIFFIVIGSPIGLILMSTTTLVLTVTAYLNLFYVNLGKKVY